MPMARVHPRTSWLVSAVGALALATIPAAPSGARPQDVLTLRGPGSRIGATFRDAESGVTASGNRGAVVLRVQAASPAAAAGIRARDILTEFDGIDVRDSRHLMQLIAETPPGRTVSLTLVRGGRARVFMVTPILGPALG